jgi:nitrogen fixation NifU-like protein
MPGLEDLYREIILDHYRSPRNRGELPVPPATRVEGFNPLCGDEIVVYVDVADGVVRDICIGGQGCSISQSSASMMTEAVSGKTAEEVEALATDVRGMLSGALEPDEDAFGELVALKGVVKYPVRVKCAVLAWDVLQEALASGEAAGTSPH